MTIFRRKESLQAMLESSSNAVELPQVGGKKPPGQKEANMPRTPASPAVEWATPPPAKNGRHGNMHKFVEILRTRPNEWAIFKKDAKSAVVVTTARKSHPDTEWTSRRNPDGSFTIYARFTKR